MHLFQIDATHLYLSFWVILKNFSNSSELISPVPNFSHTAFIRISTEMLKKISIHLRMYKIKLLKQGSGLSGIATTILVQRCLKNYPVFNIVKLKHSFIYSYKCNEKNSLFLSECNDHYFGNQLLHRNLCERGSAPIIQSFTMYLNKLNNQHIYKLNKFNPVNS